MKTVTKRDVLDLCDMHKVNSISVIKSKSTNKADTIKAKG